MYRCMHTHTHARLPMHHMFIHVCARRTQGCDKEAEGRGGESQGCGGDVQEICDSLLLQTGQAAQQVSAAPYMQPYTHATLHTCIVHAPCMHALC